MPCFSRSRPPLRVATSWLVPLFLAACGAASPSPIARELNDQGAGQLARGELDAAEASLRLSLELDPGSAAARTNLGLVALSRGDLEGAESELRGALALHPDLVEAWTDLGVVLERRGRGAEAQEAYERALAIHPGRPEPRRLVARLLVRRDRPAEARAHLLRLVALFPEDPEALGLLAWAELRVERPTAAAELIARALLHGPELPCVLFVHALLRARRGELDEARATLIALEGDPLVGREASLRVAALDAVSGASALAEERIGALLEDDPFDPAVRLVAAVIARDRGDLVAAVAHAREARELAPELPEAWLIEAECCALSGDAACATDALGHVRPATDAMLRERDRVRHLLPPT